jgi:hypothetical protein
MLDADRLLKPLQTDGGMPEWVLNNLIRQQLYVLGNDLSGFSDVLALTKMSRIGCLLERLHPFMRGIDNDYAGGLRLRKLIDGAGYYAVRGRVLLFSPSRDVLIRALTLADDATIDPVTMANLTRSGTEDLRGVVLLDPADPLGATFQSIAFAVRIDDAMAHTRFRGIFRSAWRDRFGPLVQGVSPRKLLAPPVGVIEMSADFGKPLKDVWTGLGQALNVPFMQPAQWQLWEQPRPGQETAIAPLITAALGPLGPGLRLSCVGVDLNEIVPMPELVATLDADPGAVQALVKAIPPLPPAAAGLMEWDTFPRVTPEGNVVYLPMMGGPSLEPTAAAYGNSLLVSSSRTVAQQLLAAPPKFAELPEPANLYMRVTPGPCVHDVVEAGRLLTETNFLRGYTRESFDQAAAVCQASADLVREMTLSASFSAEGIDAELRIVCNPAS